MPEKESKRSEQEERIKQLEEKIKKLEEEKERRKEPKGVTGSILEGIGEIIPGVGGLIKSLTKSEAFQERLKAIDEEVERKLREEPLKRVGEEKGKRRQLPFRKDIGSMVKPKAVTPKEVPVDVFDEEDHLRVIAEVPGVEEKDIKIDLEGNKLTIFVDTASRKYHGEASLPCSPKGTPKIFYKKGILELRLDKN